MSNHAQGHRPRGQERQEFGHLKDSPDLNSSARPPWRDKGWLWNITPSVIPSFLYTLDLLLQMDLYNECRYQMTLAIFGQLFNGAIVVHRLWNYTKQKSLALGRTSIRNWMSVVSYLGPKTDGQSKWSHSSPSRWSQAPNVPRCCRTGQEK